jgi:hypothetical protein
MGDRSLWLDSLKLKNFHKMNCEIHFNGNQTHFVGVNGSGKSSILTAIWAGLKGIAEKNSGGQLPGDRSYFIGPNGKSSDIELILTDTARKVKIKVRNHITAASNQITFEAPDGYPISQSWLNGLLSAAFLSAENFAQLSPREQALLLGIDVSDLDKKLKTQKELFTLLNRDMKNIGTAVEVAPVEKADIKALLVEKEAIDKFNLEQAERAEAITKAEDAREAAKNEVDRLRGLLEAAQVLYMDRTDAVGFLPKPEPRKSTDALMDKIHGTEETNRQAEAYKKFVETTAAIKAKQKELDDNKAKQTEIEAQRVARIAAHKFPFAGLTVDEEGGLLLNGRPIKKPLYSKGELEMIVARLYAAMNPDLKVRFLDDFETLDEENQKKLVENLLAEGFQIVTAEVGTAKKTENTILLRECKVVETYEEPKEQLLL